MPECCCYCQKDMESLLQCKICFKLFCNDTTKNVSHYVYHCIKAKHAECELPSSHPLGPLDIDCYTCKTKNIFILGSIPAQSNETMIIVCRDCNGTNKLTSEWNTSMWEPLILDKAVQDWIIESKRSALNIQDLQTIHLEHYPTRSLIQEESEIELPPVLPKYENGSEYKQVLTPLIQAEADYDKILKEMNTQDNISIRWKSSNLAEFQLSKYDELKLNLGDDLKITYHGELSKLWEGYFTVIELPHNTNIYIVAEFKRMPIRDRNPLAMHGDPMLNLTESYKIEFCWKSTSFDRMHYALKQFTTNRNAISSHIYNIILGKSLFPKSSDLQIPRNIQVQGLPKLNPIQIEVATNVLKSNFSLVQGPPGTGKTVTSATVVYHLQRATRSKVLVCSPSNVACDQLCEKLNQAKLNVVRLTAKSREHVESSVAFLSVHSIADKAEISHEYSALLTKKQSVEELSAAEDKRIRDLRKQVERKILEEADVICCTCVGAGDPRLGRMTFETVVIDEATQATEPESLIPLIMGCKRAVLIGDHEQLPPVIMSKTVAKAGLTVSLFERLVKNGFKPLMLQIQYRMHPGLSEFPSNMFYEGNLQNGVNRLNRQPTLQFPWPNNELPMLFFNCQGQEEMSGSGLSYLNRTEASVVDKIVVKLLKGILPEQIGIITPYEGQRAFITSHMMNNGSISRECLSKIEIASVDSFQGREKDYIILTCVRSNEKQGIGFLKDPRRLNVAITRAKYGLLIVGNPRVLSKNSLWYHLIMHFKNQDLLVEGPLNNLKPSQLQLVKPMDKQQKDKKQVDEKTVPFDSTLFEQSFANFSTLGTLNQEYLSSQYTPGEDLFDFATQFKHLDITQSNRVEETTFEFLGDYKTKSFDDFFPSK
eukprot:NODE_17_length_41373_cov_0.337016.p2 type:complete len:879 gc:universal NODE_17_length_41373_cov_0.337016:8591-5955(-)